MFQKIWYISACDTSACYPKQGFRNYDEIKYLVKISKISISIYGLITSFNKHLKKLEVPETNNVLMIHMS